ncbi:MULTISPECIES: type IV pilus modification PilV family protein [unclassified Fictibacillus]|uniref:type IV pilus modification PilV family protein n=1 Tax=unclassified Fictibacillus TaxID=2644029 RepID=UPI0018CCA5F8|nr:MULTISPECIES: prepilin-type N-terminal cleavage/methylation domain-containing protein [unclassified Fictibacillus]MBH0169369.1 prepilin-type N-terminal cleavage/methylation domain-containing protein [Fictibacillus sp. 18YEL24]MBH0173840.1 prepilin-type N-terminal cleavage/methylation domain-containing protein [Fictibacillus sp. 23RED33]
MLSEKGFSLIEVLISLMILSVSVIGISQFFHQANQISTGNNNKLVATNLARMTLERLQNDYEAYEIKVSPSIYEKSKCTSSECRDIYETLINNTKYETKITVKPQVGEENSIQLLPVKVTIQYTNNKKLATTSVEGYVKDVK